MVQVCNPKMRYRGGLLFLIAFATGGCFQPDTDALLSGIEQQQQTTRASIDALQKRVNLLEGERGIRFIVSGLQVVIQDQMFQPVLAASATINAQGRQLPETLYVDLMLQVEVEKENFKSTTRQIFPVTGNGGDVVLRQSLPIHGLTREQIKVTLQPVNWYAGHLIAENQIEYQ